MAKRNVKDVVGLDMRSKWKDIRSEFEYRKLNVTVNKRFKMIDRVRRYIQAKNLSVIDKGI